MDDADRDQLLDEFLSSLEAAELLQGGADPDVTGELAFHVLHFALDYVYGTPLRFSPVMVEIFCTSWAPRKVSVDDNELGVLPNVLRAWIEFAGHRRGIPDVAIHAATEAVDEYEQSLLEEATDRSNWGPAKLLARALQDGGVDITDPNAVQVFIDGVNASGGVESLLA